MIGFRCGPEMEVTCQGQSFSFGRAGKARVTCSDRLKPLLTGPPSECVASHDQLSCSHEKNSVCGYLHKKALATPNRPKLPQSQIQG